MERPGHTCSHPFCVHRVRLQLGAGARPGRLVLSGRSLSGWEVRRRLLAGRDVYVRGDQAKLRRISRYLRLPLRPAVLTRSPTLLAFPIAVRGAGRIWLRLVAAADALDALDADAMADHAMRHIGRARPLSRLPPPYRSWAQILQNEHQHGGGLHPRVLTAALRGAVGVGGAGTRGADVQLRDGRGREVAAFRGNLRNLASVIQDEARQAGPGGEIFMQVNTPGATRQQVASALQGHIRLSGPQGSWQYLRIFGPQGQQLWQGNYRPYTAFDG